jgi:hypothetical protein
MKKITLPEWHRFIDENYVSEARIEAIAQKMKQPGQLLTEKELAIYQSKAEQIEARLKEI